MKAEILILGVLHRGDMHPYEIKKRLKAAHVENYIDVDVGTLYYAVRQLAKDGLIEERGRETVGKRAERTIYGITTAGKDRLQDLMMDTLSNVTKMYHPMAPALLFLHLSDASDMAAIIKERIARYEAILATSRTFLKLVCPHLGLGLRLNMENSVNHQKVELDWLRRLQLELEKGDVQDVPPIAADNEALKEAIDTFVSTLEEKARG